jgi:NitT/TauT family transport system permease protein
MSGPAVPVSRRRSILDLARLRPPLVALAAFVLLWYLVIWLFRLPPFILPTADQTVRALVVDARVLAAHGVVTLQEVVLGMAVGVPVGALCAVAIAWFGPLERALLPWLAFFQNVPRIVIAPLFVIWFGYGMVGKVVMVILIAFFPVLLTTLVGLKSVETDLLDLTKAMAFSKWQVFRKIRLPAALPSFFGGLKLASTLATIGAIVGEWMGAEVGLGVVLLRAQDQFKTGLLFAAMIVLAAMGLALYQLAGWLERRLVPWHVSVRGTDVMSI